MAADEGPDPEKEEGPDPATEFIPPKDGSWIPRERFNEAVLTERNRADRLEALIAAERDERIRMEERLKVRETQAPKLTRAKLHDLVKEGKLTEEQAENEWEKSLKAEVRREVSEEIRSEQKVSQRTATHRGLIDQYKELIPDIAKPGTEARAKVASEYRYLVDVLGEPEGLETEAKACRSAFGPPERVRELTKDRRETHRESGGAGGGQERNSEPAHSKLPNRLREHYGKMIDKGMYSGWDDPVLKKELAFVSTRTA